MALKNTARKLLVEGTVYWTKAYSQFVTNVHQRPMHPPLVARLKNSMQRWGYWVSCPIHVTQTEDGTLIVVGGHHRLAAAQELGIALAFIIDNSHTSVVDAEYPQWSLSDYAKHYAYVGKPPYQTLIDFMERHRLPLMVSVNLLSGRRATGHDSSTFRSGDWQCASDTWYAEAVVMITDRCRELEVPCATSTNFVAAVSLLFGAKSFKLPLFMRRLNLYHRLLRSGGTVDEYITMLEKVNNTNAKEERNDLLGVEMRRAARKGQVAVPPQAFDPSTRFKKTG